MRLLHTNNYKLEKFEGHKIPLYAILSHKWSGDEITSQDIDHIEHSDRAKYEKVRKTCSIAKAHGFDYIWIDTCCIDKTSSAELSEAINSMYLCYAYLNDVPSNAVNRQTKTKSSEKHSSLLATSLAAFFNSGEIIPFNPSSTLSGAITVNNKRVHLKLRFRTVFRDVGLTILPCTENGKAVAIYLKAISETKEYFLEYREESICVRQERRIHKNKSSLPRAAANGHKALVKLLLEKGTELKAKNEDNRASLLLAAANGHEAVVKLLLEKGAELEAEDDNRRTSLLWAVAKGHEAVVKLLVEKGAELEAEDDDHQTSLLLAAAKGHEAVVKLLLKKGAELEAKDTSRRTPLLRAVAKGHEAVVKLLLEKGAELEAKDEDSRTSLLLAAANGHEAVVKLLLEKGAKLEAKDDDRRTPLLWAIANKHEAVVKLLVEKGAELEAKGDYRQTLLL
ncbi:uncharacterized protein PAC_19957 [Phialocephala subalpina]|uniref:Heterokaryon incompatibility domain-containing protein n=1 Tax=Phialocephala subalpina TaxID=576137 RepID=A0A1L7XYM2_9HELO|nr:uncharacterized protein PAC_19957 [Phialocephala subalpina]